MDTKYILDGITNILKPTIPLIKEQLYVLPPRVLGRNLLHINLNNQTKSLFLMMFKLLSHFLMFYVDLVLISVLCLHPGVAPYHGSLLNIARKIRIFSHVYTTVANFNKRVENIKSESPTVNNTIVYFMVTLTSALNIYAEYKQTLAIEFLENLFIEKLQSNFSHFPIEFTVFVLRLLANVIYQYALVFLSSLKS